MSHNELWILWGQYSNEAEVRAARNYFRVRLGFPGPQLHSVHPVPPGGLNVLNHEEQCMLRQHLGHILRQDVQDETREAVGETLLNLNTLANGRRVRMSWKTDSDDKSPTSDIPHGDPDCGGDFNLGNPPLRSRNSSKLPNRDDREHTPCSRPSSNSYAKHISGNHQSGSSRSDATYGTRSRHGDSYGRGDPPHLHSGIRLPRSRHGDSYGRGDPPHLHSGIRLPRSHSNLRQATPDRETFLQDQQPGSPASTRSDKRMPRSDANKMYPTVDDAYVRQERKAYDEEFARDFEEKLNLDQQDQSREPSAQQAGRGHIFDRHSDRRHDYGENGDRYHKRRDGRDTRRSSFKDSPYESSERPSSAGIHDKYEYTYEAGCSPRFENQRRSKHLRNDEYGYQRSSGRNSRHSSGEDSRHNDKRGLEDNYNHEAYHRRVRHHHNSNPHGRRECGSESRSENDSRRPHRNESTFGPFSAELIFSVIQKGERADFFDALYELHPEHTPSSHRANRMRKSWLSWKYTPLIVKLLRKGSVRDIEKVFDTSNMDDLFRELKGEISSRRNLW